MSWLSAFKDKKIVVLGAGMTGLSCLRFLHAQGLSFVVNDSRTMPFANAEEAQQYQRDFPNATFEFGQWQHQLIANADVIVASPGIDLLSEGLSAIMPSHCQVMGDIELFCLVNNSRVNPMKLLAVTGSNGKSTVVSLLAYLGQALNKNVTLAGNIGTPILDLLTLDLGLIPDIVILELSSFQLETMKSMQALAATVLNLSDDHLDRHKTLANYQKIKQSIYPQANIAIVNRDDSATHSVVKGQPTVSFGLGKPAEGNYGLVEIDDNQYLSFGEQKLIALKQLPLAGLHNALNYMAALALGQSAGWSLTSMTEKLAGFTGLAHRCQRVKSADSIQWINDSKATNVGATIAAIQGLFPTISASNKLILIAGGDGKGADFSVLKPLLSNSVSQLITLGKDGSEIAKLVSNAIEVASLIDAVNQAKKIANTGDLVLLSPACASIDMFKNFMARGEQFMAAVTSEGELCR